MKINAHWEGQEVMQAKLAEYGHELIEARREVKLMYVATREERIGTVLAYFSDDEKIEFLPQGSRLSIFLKLSMIKRLVILPTIKEDIPEEADVSVE